MPEMTGRTLYERLRDDLVAGAFGPGERLSENRIGARYGMSRTPVREALARLEHDGLVDRAGSVVSVPAPTVEHVLDLFDARISLAGSQARHAAERRREGDLAVLQAALSRGRVLAADAPEPALLAANRAFHQALSDAAHNDVLAVLQGQLDLRVAALRATTLTAPGRWAVAVAEHEALVDAVTDGDGERAAGIAAQHIQEARDLWLGLVRTGALQQGARASQPVPVAGIG